MKKIISLSEGSIKKNMLLFAIPIFIGQLLQQLYSIIDSLIVGNFVDDNALGAVNSTGAISFLFIGLVSGIFLGAGVLISRYFGAKDIESMSKSIHTSIAFAIICGFILMILGIVLTPFVLELMKTPEEILPDAITYLRILFIGSIFTAGYNCTTGIFQSVGDTKRPLYFLIIATIINILLNLLFIIVFEMGVAGAAWATIIGQAVSMILGFIVLFRTTEVYKIRLKDIKFHKGFVVNVIKQGLPAGIQNSVISFANIMVQASINIFAADAVTGSGVYNRIEALVFVPVTSFSFALTTFVSQNIGANKPQRVKEGIRFGIITSFCIATLFGIISFFFAENLISLFSDSKTVIAYGVERAKIQSLFFFFIAIVYGYAAVLRGAGRSMIPMISMLVCWCVIRIIFINVTLIYVNDIRVIYWAYPLTWGLCAIVLYVATKLCDITKLKEKKIDI